MNGEHYNAILTTLADKLLEQQNTILIQKWKIEDLEKKLAEAQKNIDSKGEKPKTLEIR